MWKIILPILKGLGKQALLLLLHAIIDLLEKKHSVTKLDVVNEVQNRKD